MIKEELKLFPKYKIAVKIYVENQPDVIRDGDVVTIDITVDRTSKTINGKAQYVH